MRLQTFRSAATVLIVSFEEDRTTFIFSTGVSCIPNWTLRNSSSMSLLSKF